MELSERLAWPEAPDLPTLVCGDRVHLLGIGGAGMSGLARALASSELVVSGCDLHPSPLLEELAAEGITVVTGHDPAHLDPPPRLVVHSPAVPGDNPELAAARQLGLTVTRRAILLGALIDQRTAVAVAGTHGKTTTSALVATILEQAGLEPGFFIGGHIPDLGTNARLGGGQLLVVEADEYDYSFLHGHPALAVITYVEHDHPDQYPDLDAVVDAFRRFVALIKPGGRLIANAGSPAVHRVLEAASVPVQLYHVEGDPAPPEGVHLTWRAHLLETSADGQRFALRHHGVPLGSWVTRLPGRHNVGNAVAAIAAALALGASPSQVRRALAHYRGAERRFQVIGQADGVVVIDDYAHHPTEIAATIRAARERFPTARLWAILEPHTFTRVAAMAPEFAAALRLADRAIVTPVYPAREEPLVGADATSIAAGVPGAQLASDLADAARLTAEGAAPGDVLLFMGAGDLPRASRTALAELHRRAAQRLISESFKQGLEGEVLPAEPLSAHTSLHVGGPADLLVRVRSIDDLAGWWLLAHRLGLPVRVIGRGSNLLVSDRGFHGLIVENRCEQWQLVEADHTAAVTADSGITLSELVHTLARRGWGGLEAAAGIPGSLGGAVINNAGAHGWCLADSLTSVQILSRDGALSHWTGAQLELGYRTSMLKGNPHYLVLRVSLEVHRQEPAELHRRLEAYAERRRATQPTAPSCGSVFRNPPGDYAGRLIEAAGLKGHRIGGAVISPVHANFIVNDAQATASDVWALIRLARHEVAARFGVELELEIEPLGFEDVG